MNLDTFCLQKPALSLSSNVLKKELFLFLVPNSAIVHILKESNIPNAALEWETGMVENFLIPFFSCHSAKKLRILQLFLHLEN